MSTECLPVIIVSAVNTETANKFITDIVSNSELISSESSTSPDVNGYVWLIENKYYNARVCLVADGDEAEQRHCANEDDVEAHIIYLTETECESGAEAEAAAARRSGRGGGAAVRLLAAARGAPGRAPPGYELVALEDADDDDDEFPSACGVQRVREALHAHTWRGLRRRAAGRAAAAQGAGEEDEEAAAEARSEQLLAALAALGGAAALAPAQRRAHADSVLAAFCAALGVPLDDL